MRSNVYPQLQLAVDVLSSKELLKIAENVYPNFDIIEMGTSLNVTGVSEKFLIDTLRYELLIAQSRNALFAFC